MGDPLDACAAAAGYVIGPYRGSVSTLRAIPLDRLEVAKAASPYAWRADLNNDGVIDVADIRAFADQHGLPLLPKFEQQLWELERVKDPRQPSRPGR